MSKFTVATLNCWLFGYHLSPYNIERCEHIISHAATSGVDVLLLQEVWGPDEATYLVQLAKNHGFNFSTCGNGGGLITVSKYPLEDVMLHSFGSRGLPLAIHHLDYWAKKGALVVTVRPDGGSPVRLVNTHLIARYTSHGQEHGDEYLGHRAAQIAELISILQCQDQRVATIVCGDFNLDTSDPEFEAFIYLTGLEDVAEAATHALACALTPFATVSLAHSPFSAPSHIAKKLDHVMIKQRSDDKDVSLIPSDVSLDFVDVWSASSKQSWIETQICSVLGRQPASTEITYSDHVGIRASFQFLPTVPAPVPHVGAASKDPSKHHKLLSSKILVGQQQAWQRASKHGAIACTLAVGAFACQSGVFRSARKFMAAAAVFEAALAAHALWDVSVFEKWKQTLRDE